MNKGLTFIGAESFALTRHRAHDRNALDGFKAAAFAMGCVFAWFPLVCLGAEPVPAIHRNAREDTALNAAVWKDVENRAAKAPDSGYNHFKAALAGRPKAIAYYAKFANWTPPEPLPVSEGKLRNLAETPVTPRFPITDKVWPAKAGEASICLWEDDKVAAFSVGNW